MHVSYVLTVLYGTELSYSYRPALVCISLPLLGYPQFHTNTRHPAKNPPVLGPPTTFYVLKSPSFPSSQKQNAKNTNIHNKSILARNTSPLWWCVGLSMKRGIVMLNEE